MKTYFLLAALLISEQVSAATWRCTEMSTIHTYVASQNVPTDRCIKTSEADPTDAERQAVAILEPAEAQREQKAEKAAVERETGIASELKAAANSSFTCKGKAACGKAFALAQIYVQQHSDQKIQVATDTIIDTYNPTEDGKIGITVTKVPSVGSKEVINIDPHCRMDDIDYEKLCRLKRTVIYSGFRSFIEK